MGADKSREVVEEELGGEGGSCWDKHTYGCGCMSKDMA